MILDGHIHIRTENPSADQLQERFDAAGVEGGVVISLPPAGYVVEGGSPPFERRLEQVLGLAGPHPNLFPFLWIDPLDPDVAGQIDRAARANVAGFKIICDRFYPGDPEVVRACSAVSETGKPILFHSGILWDGKDSSRYNRPGEFESLLDVRNLRFCLAHISWPWCDELVAVYGKFLNAFTRRSDLAVEMFVDVTPGTPPIYRRPALANLFCSNYDVGHNVIFGLDCTVEDYNVEWARQWIERDTAIYRKLGLSDEIINAVFSENLKRFVGVSTESVERDLPRPGR